MQARLIEIFHPATQAQVAYFHDLRLQERTLGLVVMVACGLGLIWRQISGVNELAQLIRFIRHMR